MTIVKKENILRDICFRVENGVMMRYLVINHPLRGFNTDIQSDNFIKGSKYRGDSDERKYSPNEKGYFGLVIAYNELLRSKGIVGENIYLPLGEYRGTSYKFDTCCMFDEDVHTTYFKYQTEYLKGVEL